MSTQNKTLRKPGIYVNFINLIKRTFTTKTISFMVKN